jgi:chromatin assembly factor 1 subunit B
MLIFSISFIMMKTDNLKGSNSGPGGMPLFTPPQTPGHHVNGSTNSVPGIAAPSVKRESNASESGNVAAGVKRESQASESTEESGREKRRRIAPTPVVEGEVTAPAPPPPPQPATSGSGE